MPKGEPQAFTAACKDFFGYRPGTGLMDFSKELKELTPEDKEDIAAGLVLNGYVIKTD